jgi:3-oxoacyl-[acyl-carrier protein] reductase
MFTFEGRTAVVTGASGNIGRKVVEMLAGAGMKVAICTHGEHAAARSLESFSEDIRKNCIPLGCEMDDPEDMRLKYASLAEQTGGIDALILIHGRSKEYREQSFETLDPDYVTQTIANHATGSYNLIREALPYLKESPAGRIVLTADSDSRIGGDHDAIGVTMAKGATISLTYSTARRLAKYGVTVNCVAMGGIMNIPVGAPKGPMPHDDKHDHEPPKDDHRPPHNGPVGPAAWIKPEELYSADDIPLGRLAKPEDVASAICFLVSEEAGYITGEVMNVSGGICMG